MRADVGSWTSSRDSVQATTEERCVTKKCFLHTRSLSLADDSLSPAGNTIQSKSLFCNTESESRTGFINWFRRRNQGHHLQKSSRGKETCNIESRSLSEADELTRVDIWVEVLQDEQAGTSKEIGSMNLRKPIGSGLDIFRSA